MIVFPLKKPLKKTLRRLKPVSWRKTEIGYQKAFSRSPGRKRMEFCDSGGFFPGFFAGRRVAAFNLSFFPKTLYAILAGRQQCCGTPTLVISCTGAGTAPALAELTRDVTVTGKPAKLLPPPWRNPR
jgi:hypothetical protein